MERERLCLHLRLLSAFACRSEGKSRGIDAEGTRQGPGCWPILIARSTWGRGSQRESGRVRESERERQRERERGERERESSGADLSVSASQPSDATKKQVRAQHAGHAWQDGWVSELERVKELPRTRPPS